MWGLNELVDDSWYRLTLFDSNNEQDEKETTIQTVWTSLASTALFNDRPKESFSSSFLFKESPICTINTVDY